MTSRVNLGCGGQTAIGWQGLDIGGAPDLLHDVRNGLPYRDGEVTTMVAHHLLCQLDPDEIDALLAECHRCLHPDGVLRISLIDLHAALHAADNGNESFFWMAPTGSLPAKLAWYVLGNQRRSILTAALVHRQLLAAGFDVYRNMEHTTVSTDPEIRRFDGRNGESFFIEGQRR